MNEAIIFGLIYGLIIWGVTKKRAAEGHEPTATVRFNVISSLIFGVVTAACFGFHDPRLFGHFLIFLKYTATGLLVNAIIRWLRQRQKPTNRK